MPRFGHDRATEETSACGVSESLASESPPVVLVKNAHPWVQADSYTCQIKKPNYPKGHIVKRKVFGFHFLILSFDPLDCPHLQGCHALLPSLLEGDHVPLSLCHFVPCPSQFFKYYFTIILLSPPHKEPFKNCLF